MLEVYRDPVGSAKGRSGGRYRRVERFGPDATVSPLAAPGAPIVVADLPP